MPEAPASVLVTDFDGTVTRQDFYELVVADLLPPGTPDYWAEFSAGRITHFEGLRGYFASIRADEAAVLQLVARMQIDPSLAQAAARLQEAGWKIVVASAGCQWYIDRLLSEARVDFEVHANPGRFEPGRGLLMELPKRSRFFSPTHGIDKAAIVRHFQATAEAVAFAGDGFPDAEAARLVPADLRFARNDLAEALTSSGHAYRSFSIWSEVADALLGKGEPPGRCRA